VQHMTKHDDLQIIANILRRYSMISKECWDEDGNVVCCGKVVNNPHLKHLSKSPAFFSQTQA
jgi:hypothetical protein